MMVSDGDGRPVERLNQTRPPSLFPDYNKDNAPWFNLKSLAIFCPLFELMYVRWNFDRFEKHLLLRLVILSFHGFAGIFLSNVSSCLQIQRKGRLDKEWASVATASFAPLFNDVIQRLNEKMQLWFHGGFNQNVSRMPSPNFLGEASKPTSPLFKFMDQVPYLWAL